MAPQYGFFPDYVCFEARGSAAASFLHAQLSQSIEALPAGRAVPSGWLDARGRVRALFRAVRDGDRFLLLTARDGAAEVLKKLRMFVLRSPVTLEVAAELEVAAVVGTDAEWLEARGLPATAAAGTHVTVGALHWIAVTSTYWLAVGSRTALAAVVPGAPPELPSAALAEIALGIPLVTSSLVDRFVAQMLNLDLLGAVAFDKGCYPGQEIVARVHHLSDVKRRVRRYALSGSATVAVGGAVTTAAGEVVGEVVRSASTGSGVELLAVVDNAAAALPLACAGAPLAELPLPYALPR